MIASVLKNSLEINSLVKIFVHSKNYYNSIILLQFYYNITIITFSVVICNHNQVYVVECTL